MKAVLHWLPVAIGFLFLVSLAYVQRGKALRGENDFAQLYTGARLVGTPDLYSRSANLAVVQATLGFTIAFNDSSDPLLLATPDSGWRPRQSYFLWLRSAAFFGSSSGSQESVPPCRFLRRSAFRRSQRFAVGKTLRSCWRSLASRYC